MVHFIAEYKEISLSLSLSHGEITVSPGWLTHIAR
jgi:hypothetical protein